MVDDGKQHLLRFLGSLEIGDILYRTDAIEQFAVLVELQTGQRMDPDGLPCHDDTVGYVVRRPLECSSPSRLDRGLVVRMNT